MASSKLNGSDGVALSSPLHYIAQVIRKLNDGTYPTEETKCFCGDASQGSVLVERDRYTIPHRMVLCENCMLIRANPRMTQAAYANFYNDEYRKIYDGFEHGAQAEDDDYLFQLAANKAVDLKALLQQFDVRPQVVVDIGSNLGGTLMPYKEDGVIVHGVEICARGRAYAASKCIPTVKTIDTLIDKGIRADLIIMQDMIEHLADLNEMSKLKDLLAPKGHIFIYTPGLLACSPDKIFQNAHTYQFIGATLEYVMNSLGYAELLLDDQIISLWKYVSKPAYAPELPKVWRKFIFEHLMQVEPRTLPPVRTTCKFTERESLTNLDSNLARGVPTMNELKGQYSGPCVVIGGGPSVDTQLDKIHQLAEAGYPIMVIERMYPWCHANGIQPAFVIQLDACDDVVEGFTHIDPDAIHLVVATTNPKVFDILQGYKQYLFGGVACSTPDAGALWSKHGYTKAVIVNTGGSVSLAAMTIAEVLGFRNLHLFGFDFMVPNIEHTYATGIAGTSVDRSYMEVEVGEEREKVLTCTSFLAFTQQFFNLVETARKWGMIESIDIYGESLINKMWDRSNLIEENKWQTSLQGDPGKSTQLQQSV